MKIRRVIAAAGAAGVLGCTGAFALPAMASAHSSTHTLKFTAVVTKEITFSSASAGRAENDLNSKGKLIGVDVVYLSLCPFTGVGYWRQLMAGSGGSQGFPVMALLMASSAVTP